MSLSGDSGGSEMTVEGVAGLHLQQDLDLEFD